MDNNAEMAAAIFKAKISRGRYKVTLNAINSKMHEFTYFTKEIAIHILSYPQKARKGRTTKFLIVRPLLPRISTQICLHYLRYDSRSI